MKLGDAQKNFEKIGLQSEQLQGISGLIDAKIENDMEKVLSEIRSFHTELKRIEDKFDTRFNTIIWVMGILMALMIALKFFGR